MNTDPLAEALDLIEHLNMDPEGRIIPLILADIAQSLRPKTPTLENDTSPANGMSTDYGTNWPARKGWSTSGNTWLCPEPGCGFGVGGLLADLSYGESDPVGEHIREHEQSAKPSRSIMIEAIRRDMERTPSGRGGAVRFTPATPGVGALGCPGDNLVADWDDQQAVTESSTSGGVTWECPACHFRGPQALTEPSLVALDRFDELIGEVRRWREVDRIFPPESQEWWDATDRFRDVADRIGGTL